VDDNGTMTRLRASVRARAWQTMDGAQGLETTRTLVGASR
jgi:hypothetical protein